MRTSHKQRVLQFLLENGSITSWEAIQNFGNTRLSGTIFNLRKEGYNIVSENEETTNRYGDKVIYSRYYLINE